MKRKINGVLTVLTFCLAVMFTSCNFFSPREKADVTSPDSVVSDTTATPPDSLDTQPVDSVKNP